MMTLQSIQAAAALPEIFLTIMASLALISGLYSKPQNECLIAYWTSIISLIVTASLIVSDFAATTTIAYNGMFIDDQMADLMKVAICLICAGVFIYSREYNRDRAIFKSEYYVLGLFAVIGMMVIASSAHLLTAYLGLELLSLSLYSMVAFYRDNRLAVEAAMKYFVLGALASSILLYGMSLLYGLTGTLELSAINSSISLLDEGHVGVALAVVMVVVALAFKLGAVPFHMWVPDVYHGAPTSTTAFIGAAPKIAAFALVMRLLIGGLEELQPMWQQMLIILALLSVAVGNIIAIAQDNLKRMLAYSTITHMGFFMFGVLSGSQTGYSASLFYILVYSIMSLGAFGIILLLARADFEADKLDDLKGLSRRNPWIAFLLLILMFSMAGVPPTLGFLAKLSVIQALINAGLIWLAITAVILAVIGAYYYLRIVKLAWFDDPVDADDEISAPVDMKLLLSVNVMLIIAVLPWVNSLISLCNAVIASS